MRERQGERKKVRTKQINKMKDRLIETDRERERERERERDRPVQVLLDVTVLKLHKIDEQAHCV